MKYIASQEIDSRWKENNPGLGNGLYRLRVNDLRSSSLGYGNDPYYQQRVSGEVWKQYIYIYIYIYTYIYVCIIANTWYSIHRVF